MLLYVIQRGLCCIICRGMLGLSERNIWMMRVHNLRLHVLLLYLMKGLLKKIGTLLSKRTERVLWSKLSLLLLVSCLFRTKLCCLWLNNFAIDTSLWTDQVLIFVFIIIDIFIGSQSFAVSAFVSKSRWPTPSRAWGTSLISKLLSRRDETTGTRLLLQLSLWDYLVVLALIHLFLLVKLVVFIVVVERVAGRTVLVIAKLCHVCIYLQV